MKPFLLAAAIVLAGLSALAQVPADTRDRLRADVEFLCSPPLEGRASATRGADAAAWFLASEMRKAGLRPAAGPGFMQPFDVVPVRLDQQQSSLRIVGEDGERRFVPDAVFFPDPTREVNLDLEVVFAGFGVTAPELGYDDYAGVNVNGKAVLVFDDEPQESDPRSVFHGTGFTLHANAWTKTLNAQQHGAAAVLIVTEPINSHRSAPRPPLRANAPRQGLAESELRIPRITIPSEAASALLDLTGHTPADWQAEIDRSLRPVSRDLPGRRIVARAVNSERQVRASWNVAGVVPGSDPALAADTVVVLAHYDHLGFQNDHLYAGANDNASGIAVLLEIARRLARQPMPRSVLFLAVGSEEQIMLGSYYYVAHPLRPLATTRAVLCLDMVGRPEGHTPDSAGSYEVTAARSNQLNLVGADFSPDLARLLERDAAKTGMTLSDKFDRDSSMRALFRCDHLPFLQKGVPAVWLFGGFHPGYHEPSDTIDALDFEKMERVVRLGVESVRALASRGAPPRFQPAGPVIPR